MDKIGTKIFKTRFSHTNTNFYDYLSFYAFLRWPYNVESLLSVLCYYTTSEVYEDATTHSMY